MDHCCVQQHDTCVLKSVKMHNRTVLVSMETKIVQNRQHSILLQFILQKH